MSMNMRKATLLLFFICILISGCRNWNSQEDRKINAKDGITLTEDENVESDQVFFLDFEKHLRNIKTDMFTINSIAKDISFVPFETKRDALFASAIIKVAYFNEHYYFSSFFHGCHLCQRCVSWRHVQWYDLSHQE